MKALTNGVASTLGVKVPEGLRMNGQFKGEGFEVNFDGHSAQVTCADLTHLGARPLDREDGTAVIGFDQQRAAANCGHGASGWKAGGRGQ